MLSEKEIRLAVEDHKELLADLEKNLDGTSFDVERAIHKVAMLVYKHVLEESPSIIVLLIEKTGNDIRKILPGLPQEIVDKHQKAVSVN